VSDYILSKNGKLLAYSVTAPKKSKDVKSGLFVYDVERDSLKAISTGRGNYRNLTFDDAGKQLAFTAEKNPEKALVKPFKLYYYTTPQKTARMLLLHKVRRDAGKLGSKRRW
jgi:Tol biopolymer transport system component